MMQSAIYSKLAKTAALAVVGLTALIAAGTAQARPHYYQDVQYVQGGAQLVITPPQLVIQAPLPHVYVAPVQPVYAQPIYTQPVYPRHVRVLPQPVYSTTYYPGRIYYINGYPYLNGHPYRGHGKKHHHVKHFKHGHGHGNGHGNGHGHGGGHR
jgi:hypothetical protein